MANNPKQGFGRPPSSQPQRGGRNNNNGANNRSRSHNRPSTSAGGSTATTSNLSVTSSVLTNTLECPVCYEIMQSPIFMCERGHNVCNSCSNKLPKPVCPNCRGKMSQIRNYALESIITEIGVKCHNHLYGCGHVSTTDKVEAHFQDCSFRQRLCPVGLIFKNCSWVGSLKDILKHTRELHPKNSLLRAGRQTLFEEFSVTVFQQDMQIVNLSEDLFIYHVKIDPAQKAAYWAIQYIGDRELENTWKYEIAIYKSNEPTKKISAVEVCYSDVESVSELFKNGKCVGVPLNVLKNFIFDNKKFTFKFYIHKIRSAMDVDDLKKNLPSNQKNKFSD